MTEPEDRYYQVSLDGSYVPWINRGRWFRLNVALVGGFCIVLCFVMAISASTSDSPGIPNKSVESASLFSLSPLRSPPGSPLPPMHRARISAASHLRGAAAHRQKARPLAPNLLDPNRWARVAAQGQTESTAEAEALRMPTENPERKEREAGRSVYDPSSYDVLCVDVYRSLRDALDDGLTRMEVEFPAAPGEDASYKTSSDTFIDNNIQFAITISGRLFRETGKRVEILLPDGPELRRAKEKFKLAIEYTEGGEGITLGQLITTDYADTLETMFTGLFSREDNRDQGTPTQEKKAKADLYFIINLTTKQLTEVEAFVNEKAKDTPVVLFNDELDTLRGDLGLPFFPGKDMHFRFLTQFKPVFYLRNRGYSKSINVAPFLINYSGALFREYPAPWQVMIKQGSGELACVAESANRYSLNEAKEEMLEALGLIEGESSTDKFLRTGYKTGTWWEDKDAPEESKAWRT